jgi:hypothetical protein
MMDRMIPRGMRLALGAALLATTGFGVRTAVAAPAPAAMYLKWIPVSQPVDVQYAMDKNGTWDVGSNRGSNSPNRVVYSAFIPAPSGGGGTPTPTPPSINLYCDYEIGRCEAFASGGSGAGYSFTWRNAHEWYDEDGYSYAYPQCWTTTLFYVQVTVTVTDSNGGTASTSEYFTCENG